MTALGRLLYARLLAAASVGRFHEEDGQTLAEYALIIAFIAIAVFAAVALLGPQISAMFSSVGNDI